MKYFCDFEFNGWHGKPISMGLVSQNGDALYLVWPVEEIMEPLDPWVVENILPLIDKIPAHVKPVEVGYDDRRAADAIAEFLRGDPMPHVVTDWPDDIRYFCESIITDPGKMAKIPALVFQMTRVDAYPTKVEGAVQHNSYWDAMALRHLWYD